MNNEHIVDVAISIARAAGEVLREGFGSVGQVELKTSAVDLVTEYDRRAEALITRRLQEAFPDHGWLAEEGGAQAGSTSDLRWYIDPLDGTNNFAHGYPFFCVSLALYRGHKGLAAVVYDPLRDECFHTSAGRGAYLTAQGQAPTRLQVSVVTELNQALVATGFPYDRQTSNHDNSSQLRAFLKRAQGVRRSGSAALDLCGVASGRLDAFWEFKLSPWDVAAGILLIQEAGGLVTAMDGASPDLNRELVDVVAGNPELHVKMQSVLESVPIPDGP